MSAKHDLLLCLKSAMVANRVLARDLAVALNNCLPYADQIGLDRNSLMQSHALLIAQKGVLPKDEQGRRYLQGEDEIRGTISKLLFGIPLVNLKRREERTFNANPEESAAETPAPIVTEISAPKVERKKTSQKPQSNGILTLCTLANHDKPDTTAFDGFIGNEEAINNIATQLQGAIARGDALRPAFIRGASGVGKTEMVSRMSKSLGKPYCRVVASVLKTADDVHDLLTNLPNGSVVHIDECHTLAPEPTAVLLDVLNGTTQYNQKDFWFVFSTNLSASLPAALKNRCMQVKLREYSLKELSQIANNTAKKESVELAQGVSDYIAARCHGIARYAVIYTESLIRANPTAESITVDMAQTYFAANGVDDLGLSDEHRQYIRVLDKLGTISAHSLAAALGENSTTEIETAIEPLLLKHGLITISSRGRTLTEKGTEYASHLR